MSYEVIQKVGKYH